MPAIESHSGLSVQSLPKYQKRTFVDISTSRTHFTALPMLARNSAKLSKVFPNFKMGAPVTMEGGTQFKFNVQVGASSTYTAVDMNDPVAPSISDYQVQAAVPIRIARVHRSYNEFELKANTGNEQITSIVESRRLAMMYDLAEGVENAFWGPELSSGDTTAFWPLRHYIMSQRESSSAAYSSSFDTTSEGGFLNENTTNFSSGPGGISRVTYPQWGNWNNQYTSFTDTDAILRIRRAMLDTAFVAPTTVPNMVPEAPDRMMYSTKSNVLTLATLARQQNDQNGNDLGYRDGMASINGVPFVYCKAVNDMTVSGTNRSHIFGIDWSTVYFGVNVDLEEKVFAPDITHPYSMVHITTLAGNLVVTEARRNFVLTT